MATWLTTADVAQWAQTSEADATGLAAAVDAAAAWVQQKRSDLDWSSPDAPGKAVKLGATMLAWRWYQRYSSSLGVTGYPDMASGGILRYDPDIAQLLGIGSSGAFVFAAARPACPDPEGA